MPRRLGKEREASAKLLRDETLDEFGLTTLSDSVLVIVRGAGDLLFSAGRAQRQENPVHHRETHSSQKMAVIPEADFPSILAGTRGWMGHPAPRRRLKLVRTAGLMSRNFRRMIAVPDVLKRLGKRLLPHRSVDVSGVLREDELVGIVFGCQHSRHVFVRQHPVVIAVGEPVRVVQVPVAHFHPDP